MLHAGCMRHDSGNNGCDIPPKAHMRPSAPCITVIEPCMIISHGQVSPSYPIRVYVSFPWPGRGACGLPTCPWPTCRCWLTSSFAISCPTVPTCPIWALYLIPMALKRHLWPTDLALAILYMLANLIVGDFMSTSPIMPNYGSLCYYHGLEEAPVAH